MNELTSLGLILLLALLAGHLVKVVRIPEVTGYLLAGVALGPSMLGWLSRENLLAMGVMSEVALGLILFSVGTVFEFGMLRRIGRRVVVLTMAESLLAAVIVTAGMLAVGQSWQIACLLGAIAIATAPASTLMVVRECDSAGPLTDTSSGSSRSTTCCCITIYSLLAAGIDLTHGRRRAAEALAVAVFRGPRSLWCGRSWGRRRSGSCWGCCSRDGRRRSSNRERC